MSGQREEHSAYQSYLLRLWHTHSEGAPVWRASLEDPLTEEVLRFDSLPDLFAFLGVQTSQELPGRSPDGKAPPTIVS
jgi:hypothetical protein